MKISIVLAALTGSFETDMTRASKTAQKRMKEIEATAKKVGQAVGVALTAAATASAVAVKAAIDRADELSKTSQKIGITTESLSTLSYAAELADVELGALQAGLSRLTVAQGEAADGNEELANLFNALGVSFENADGTLRDTGDTFRDVAKALERIPDGATKTKAAIELMGRSGANLIPLTKGLEEAEQRARDLGLELSTVAGKDAEEFNDRLTDAKLLVTSLATAVAVELLPDLNRLVGTFQEGAEKGADFKNTASDIADGIRAVGTVANFVYKAVQGLALGLIGLFDSAAAGAANIGAIFSKAAADDARVLSARAESAFALSGQAFSDAAGGGPVPQGVSPSTGSRPGRAAMTRDAATEALREAEAERAVADALKQARIEAEKAAAAKASNAAANRAAADAARDAEQAAKAEAEAAKKLAEERYEQQKELRELRAEEARQMQEAMELVDQTLADIAFETKLIGLNNLEREKAIALRYAQVDAASAEGQAISKAMEDLDAARKQAEGVDFARDSTKGLFVDLTDGIGKASDAVDDFFENLRARAMQALADRLFDGLFDGMKSSNSGFGAVLGELFGGARAAGGPVMSGVPYLVGEEGPELIVPTSAGTVIPAAQTAAMGRLGGPTNITFVLPGRNDMRTESQRQSDLARSTNRQLARGTA